VDTSSAAATEDLESGDVIQEVNRKPVRSVAEYNRTLAGAGNQAILLLVNRAGATRYIVVPAQ
jgi:S1-C subfamily serine protease